MGKIILTIKAIFNIIIFKLSIRLLGFKIYQNVGKNIIELGLSQFGGPYIVVIPGESAKIFRKLLRLL